MLSRGMPGSKESFGRRASPVRLDDEETTSAHVRTLQKRAGFKVNRKHGGPHAASSYDELDKAIGVENVNEREQKGFGGFRKGGVCWRQESRRSGNSAFERRAPSASDDGPRRKSRLDEKSTSSRRKEQMTSWQG